LSHVGFPAGPGDTVLRQLLDQRAEVVLVNIDPQNPQRAIRTIELIHANIPGVTIFAVGEMSQPTNIVSAMRAGAREFLDHASSREALVEAFTRFSATLSRAQRSASKARVLTFLNAKGGAGATTTAVNTAVALQDAHGRVVLVDFAPIGHAALQLNLRPQFTIIDALQNLHRMDGSLLDGLMTPYRNGLHLLAGAQQPHNAVPTASELARLFDLLVKPISLRRARLLRPDGWHDADDLRPLERRAAGHADRRRFAVERWPDLRVPAGGSGPRSPADRDQPLQKDSRLHRRRCGESHQL